MSSSISLSPAAFEAAIASPEQFLAAQTLLKAAAESRRSADLIDSRDDAPEMSATLRAAADAAHAAGAALVAYLTWPDDSAAVLAELIHHARI